FENRSSPANFHLLRLVSPFIKNKRMEIHTITLTQAGVNPLNLQRTFKVKNFNKTPFPKNLYWPIPCTAGIIARQTKCRLFYSLMKVKPQVFYEQRFGQKKGCSQYWSSPFNVGRESLIFHPVVWPPVFHFCQRNAAASGLLHRSLPCKDQMIRSCRTYQIPIRYSWRFAEPR